MPKHKLIVSVVHWIAFNNFWKNNLRNFENHHKNRFLDNIEVLHPYLSIYDFSKLKDDDMYYLLKNMNHAKP
jgi:hypothetical protein